MTQDEHWDKSYEAILCFVKSNKRRPSKYYPEDAWMHNWLKFNRKRFNHNLMPPHRLERYLQLEELLKQYRCANQYGHRFSDE